MQRPSIHPYTYSVFHLAVYCNCYYCCVFTSLLLLFHYCYFHKIITTDKPLRARLLSGAAELTTHLLRLISILWLPLCRINKLGFTSLEDCGDPLYLWVISSLLRTLPRKASIALSSETSSVAFLMVVHRWRKDRTDSLLLWMHARSSSIDVGRLDVARKFFTNLSTNSSQLWMLPRGCF